MCSKKSCAAAGNVNYPLRIKVGTVEKEESEFNAQFVARMIPKLDWKALGLAARDVRLIFFMFVFSFRLASDDW